MISGVSPNALITLKPRQNSRHFADNIFKHNVINENVSIFYQISLKFVPGCSVKCVPGCSVSNKSALAE